MRNSIVFGIAIYSFLILGLSSAFAQAPDKEFTIAMGETLTFNSRNIARVTVGSPEVVSARNTGDGRQIILTGKSQGVTTVNMFSARGPKTLLVRVVAVNPESLAEEIREVLGEHSGVDVRVVRGRVLLEGEVSSDINKVKIDTLAKIYPSQVMNFTKYREAFVEGARQIALEIDFVQVAHTDRDRLGIHWGQFLGANYSFGLGDVPLYYGSNTETRGGILPGESNPDGLPSPVSITGGQGTGYFSLVGNLNAALDLIEQVGILKSVQSGTIVTETGTEAEYRTGGTYIIQTSGLGASGLAEIPFGLKIKVTPILDFENKVKLKLEAEYKELDFSTASGGIPSTRESLIKATVNMVEGQSVLVMAHDGYKDTSINTGIWMLGRIPFLGFLFKGRARSLESTNGALFVTPRIYEPGGKVHKTLVKGVFESLVDDGLNAGEFPELKNAAAKGAKKKKKKSKKKVSTDTKAAKKVTPK